MSRANPRFRRINPPLPSVGATNLIVLYRIWGTIENQLTITTFYYSAGAVTIDRTHLATLLTNISAVIFTVYKGCLSLDWTCTKETLDVVSVNNISGVLSIANAGAGGARPAGHVPTEVSIVLIRYSAVKGQHGRGRIGLPAVSTTDVVLSHIAGGAILTATANLAAAMLNTTTDGTITWTPTQIQRSTTSPRLVIGFSPLTTVTVQTLLGTIRRRKIGRGK